MSHGTRVLGASQHASVPAEPVGPTSLVLISATVGERHGSEAGARAFCPRAGFGLVDLGSGVVVRGRCDSYGCEFCGPRRMNEWPWILAWPAPERFVTLTLAPEDKERRRAQVRDLIYRLRKRGYRWESAWSTERNPKGTGLHIHMLQHGDYVPQRELQELWGGRRVDIRALKGREDRSAVVGLYMLKEGLRASGYVVKESYGLDGRPVHLSRGYLRGKTVDEVRGLIRESRSLLNEAQRRRVPVDDVPARAAAEWALVWDGYEGERLTASQRRQAAAGGAGGIAAAAEVFGSLEVVHEPVPKKKDPPRPEAEGTQGSLL